MAESTSRIESDSTTNDPFLPGNELPPSILSPPVKFILTHNDAVPPTKAYEYDAGFDICCLKSFNIGPYQVKKIRTGIRYELQPHTFMTLQNRSSLAAQQISVEGGVLDSGYKGEVYIILHNMKDNIHIFSKGAKIAQLVLHPLLTPRVETIRCIDNKIDFDGMEEDEDRVSVCSNESNRNDENISDDERMEVKPSNVDSGIGTDEEVSSASTDKPSIPPKSEPAKKKVAVPKKVAFNRSNSVVGTGRRRRTPYLTRYNSNESLPDVTDGQRAEDLSLANVSPWRISPTMVVSKSPPFRDEAWYPSHQLTKAEKEERERGKQGFGSSDKKKFVNKNVKNFFDAIDEANELKQTIGKK